MGSIFHSVRQDSVGDIYRFIQQVANQYWLPILVLASLSIHIFSVITGSLAATSVTADSALFHHGGWAITQGYVPYVDFWDINPPLMFLLTAALSVVAGGDPYAMYYVSVAVSIVTMIGVSAFLGAIIHTQTRDGLAAVLAGISIYIFPAFYEMPITGVRPKFFLMLFGLFGIYLALNERWLLAGVAGSMAAGFHQAGIVFMALVVGLAFQTANRDPLKRTLVGSSIPLFAVLVLFAYWSALEEMIVQVLLASVIVEGRGTFGGHLVRTINIFGYILPVVLVGIAGWGRTVLYRQELWFIPAGGVAFLAYNLLVDMDSSPDLFMLFVFVALGIGVIVATGDVLEQVGTVLVVATAIAVFGHLSSTGRPDVVILVIDQVLDTTYVIPDSAEGTIDMTDLYFSQIVPETCHWRLSGTEVKWIDMFGGSYGEASCVSPSLSDVLSQ